MDVTPVTPEKAKPNTMSRGTARGKLWKVRVQGGRAVYRSLYEKLEKSGAVKKMATTYRDKGGDSDGNGVPSFEVIVGLAVKTRAGGLVELSGVEGWDIIKETRRGETWRKMAFEVAGDRARRVAYEKRDGKFVWLKPSMGPADNAPRDPVFQKGDRVVARVSFDQNQYGYGAFTVEENAHGVVVGPVDSSRPKPPNVQAGAPAVLVRFQAMHGHGWSKRPFEERCNFAVSDLAPCDAAPPKPKRAQWKCEFCGGLGHKTPESKKCRKHGEWLARSDAFAPRKRRRSSNRPDPG